MSASTESPFVESPSYEHHLSNIVCHASSVGAASNGVALVKESTMSVEISVGEATVSRKSVNRNPVRQRTSRYGSNTYRSSVYGRMHTGESSPGRAHTARPPMRQKQARTQPTSDYSLALISSPCSLGTPHTPTSTSSQPSPGYLSLSMAFHSPNDARFPSVVGCIEVTCRWVWVSKGGAASKMV